VDVDHLRDGGAAEKHIEHWILKYLSCGDISEPEEGGLPESISIN
jgi:hypothetical protein